MDSLMAVEMRNRLLRQFGSGFTIDATAAFDYPTIGSLAEYLASQTPEHFEAEASMPLTGDHGSPDLERAG